jgi:hypothetical protein
LTAPPAELPPPHRRGRPRRPWADASTDAIWSSFKGEAPQADQLATAARQYQVQTVVLSIGGNDLDISGVLETCGEDYVYDYTACTADGSAQNQVATALKSLPGGC